MFQIYLKCKHNITDEISMKETHSKKEKERNRPIPVLYPK